MSRELREEAREREKEQERAKRRREEFVRDIKTLAGTPEGGRVFRWLIDQGGIFAEGFQPGPAGAYQAGRRAAAIRLWLLLQKLLPGDAFAAIVLPPGEDGFPQEREERLD